MRGSADGVAAVAVDRLRVEVAPARRPSVASTTATPAPHNANPASVTAVIRSPSSSAPAAAVVGATRNSRALSAVIPTRSSSHQ
ncbi:hypothetical protein BFL35_01690 [Clavibacter michiganensis]|nr:hypothetical protein BFL35_01690 [Clavibacter michiganensis]